MKPGDRVRLKSDPARVGILTGDEQIRGGRRRLYVMFTDMDEDYILEHALEKIESESLDPFKLFREGRYGRSRDLRGALTYYRLSGRLANLIYSMNTTNTEFYPYQFKPVLNFLDSPCRGLLIADEVGLGKTIEAGLIWTELRSRFDARRLLVICPAMLREKWRDELLNRFGISAEICNAGEILTRLKQFKVGDRDEFALIASIQGLRPPKGWEDVSDDKSTGAASLARYFTEQEDEEPLFDAVIIDEAHYLRNPETQTAKLGRLLRPITDSLILISATPIQLRSDDLFYLLNLLDEDSFPYNWSFQAVLRANAPLVHLRNQVLAGPMPVETLKHGLNKTAASHLVSKSLQLRHLIENPPSQEDLKSPERRSALADTLDRINPLTRVVSRTRKRDVHEWRVIRQPVAFKAARAPVEEAFYEEVTACVRDFCCQYDFHEGFMLTIPQRQMCSSMAAACRAWLRKLPRQQAEELLFEAIGTDDIDIPPVDLGPLVEELVQIVRRVGNYQALKANDSKFSELLRQLKHYWREYPDNKVVLFSYYRDTLEYLRERLAEEGIDGIVLKGGMDKYAALQQFQESEGPRILLSSEVASEGVDLQFCSLLINYDLPWNPMRVEQRIGRIDRIGQKADRISIWNMFYADTLDDRIYTRLFQRLRIFEQALGSIEAVLGEEIRIMSYDLLRHHLSAEQEQERVDQTYQAIANNNLNQERLEQEATHLVAHGEYIQNKVREAQELNRFITGDHLYAYFRDFFDKEYPGCRFIRLEPDQLIYQIELSSDARVDLEDFLYKEKLLGKTRLAALDGPRKMRYLFENKVGRPRPDVEVISQYHPVIRFINIALKGQPKAYYYPVVALEVSNHVLPKIVQGIYAFAVQRWSVQGARYIERLVFQAVNLNNPQMTLSADMAEELINTAAMSGHDWHEASNLASGESVEMLYEQCLDVFDVDYDHYIGELTRENDDRINFQIQTLESHQNKQLQTLNNVLEKHRANNRKGLISATEGKIAKLKQRVSEKIKSLEKARTLHHEKRNVSSGIIRVY